MQIELWEPAKQRRLRVKNKVRFIIFMLIVLALFALFIYHTRHIWVSVWIDRVNALQANLNYWLK